MPIDENAPRREELIQALETSGLKAYEALDEDGTRSVGLSILDARYTPAIVAAQDPELISYIVNVLDEWSPETYLQIVVKEADDSHIVGVVGQKGDGGKIYEIGEWQRAATIEQGILIVQSLWAGRDVLLNEFVGTR